MGKPQKTSNRKPRFFCDNCGIEVPLNAKSCPGCGRFFTSVRCPSCGYSDEEVRFLNGCPSCGYSARPKKPRNPGNYSERKTNSDPMPLWVYILTAAAFTAVLAALFFKLFKV